MKYILGLLLLIIFTSGCKLLEKDKEIINKNVCQNTCEYEDTIGIIEKYFGLNADEYTIKCSDCRSSRGDPVIMARIIKDAEPIELYYKGPGCSSGGSCSVGVCFTSFSEKTNDLYQSVKNRYCKEFVEGIYSNPYNPDLENRLKNDIENKCLKGDFESIKDGKRTFSIVRSISGFGSPKTYAGQFECFDNYVQ